MGRERVYDVDLRPQGDFLAEHLDRFALLDDAPAEGVLGLEADDQYDVVLVLGAVLQVVEDASALAHPARGDDYHWSGGVVQSHRLGRGAYEVHSGIFEGILAFREHRLGLVIVDLAVLRVDARGLLRKGRVDVDLDLARHLSALAKLVEVPDDLLGTSDRERGNQQLRVVAVDVLQVAFEPQLYIVRRWMVPVGVGGLDKQYVGAGRILEVAQDRLVRLA